MSKLNDIKNDPGLDDVKSDAIELAKNKAYDYAAICLVNGVWVAAAHYERRYFSSYEPFDKATMLFICNVLNEPHVWTFKSLAGLADLLDSL